MPWTKSDVDDFKEGLNESQKEQWVSVANSVYKDCMDKIGNDNTCSSRAIKQANGVVGNMSENKFVNSRICAHAKTASSEIRTETWKGDKYKVAPVVAVAEGVLKGKFLPDEEIRNTAQLWNDTPLPVVHPEEAGKKISARDPKVIEENGIGRFFNAHYEDGKLKGEIWINIERAEEKGGDYKKALDTIRANEQLEVSTGFYSFPESQSGNYDGEHYTMVHRNVIPDHLALLPNAEGECSWADGCGAPRINSAGDYMNNNLGELIANARSTARTPSYSGTTTGDWSAPNLEDFGYDSVDSMSSSEITDVAEHTLLGDANADTVSELLVLPVVGSNGNLNKNALANAKARVNQVNKVSGDAVDSVKNRCTQLLKDEFDVEYSTETDEGLINHMMDKFTNQVKKILRGENQMSKDKLVSNLADKMEVEESEFEEWDEEKLRFLADKYEIEDEEEEPSESEKLEDNESEETASAEVSVKFEDFLEGEEVEEKLEAMVDEKVSERENKSEKSDLIDTIVTNSDELEKEELEDKDVDSLKTMASLVKSEDYSGIGGPRDHDKEPELEWLKNREARIRGEE